MNVFRCFTEKKTGFDLEAEGLCLDLRAVLGVTSLEYVRIFNRYDVEGISEDDYRKAVTLVFSEPPSDECHDESLPPVSGGHRILAVEPLPGQFDVRADSAAQCVSMLSCTERPRVNAAKVYILGGSLSDDEFARISDYLINPVESRVASHEKPETLENRYPEPSDVPVLEGFTALDRAGLESAVSKYGLAMDLDDIAFLQAYFREEGRDPTLTELRVVDTYWSDHCRHTTFLTHIEDIRIGDPAVKAAFDRYLEIKDELSQGNAKITLMDIATCAARYLSKNGGLSNLDRSEEINACSIEVDATVDGKIEKWLLMFKNETHNHPTEIEPFGGAATCIGGAIRDPLSGRSYVYQAMRVTGAGDPRTPLSETPKGKLPQRKLTQTAAAGYSSYGNQIGLATGLVHEIYHPGYVAKRMEIGAVVGAAPKRNVVRERPVPGDVIILLGGRTGRDGCGGATGSSKTLGLESITECSSEVQKGNAPEERKLQRLFRKADVSRMIRRCNDFGAGGVSVAIGELADSLEINLDAVPKKYEGLDGTELAISESQERMAVVVSARDADAFILEASKENLEATPVARVTDDGRLRMTWRGKEVCSLRRSFLNSNGAPKSSFAEIPPLPTAKDKSPAGASFRERLLSLAGDINFCSQRGLGERFDGSIGAASVLMPYGGVTGLAPAQAMAALLPVEGGETDTCSVMSFGFDPYISEQNPFEGARRAVTESVAKIVAAGCDYKKTYLTFQEYFEKLRQDPLRWGKPLSALLGALDAQLGLGVAAIGGKDSMSGSFMDMDVPPTLVSFAIAPASARDVLSPEFKREGSKVYLFKPSGGSWEAVRGCFERFSSARAEGKILSAWAVTSGGAAEGLAKMSLGNMIGFAGADGLDEDLLFSSLPGAILAEASCPIPGAELLGETKGSGKLEACGSAAAIAEIIDVWEDSLEGVFPSKADAWGDVRDIECREGCALVAKKSFARPRAVIPVFPGTNCEYDTARAVRLAGGESELVVIRNLTAADLEDSVERLRKATAGAQMLILPGGFSAADEPDGSGKFIAAMLRNPNLTEAIHELLFNRDGLMLGICNGFQALIKLGMFTDGRISEVGPDSATLTFNVIGRHQSRYVYTKVTGVKSPWMSRCNVGDMHAVPISHGEGRFVAPPEVIAAMIENGQIVTRYTDISGRASMDISVNPNGSMEAIEGIISPCGRVLGKMGHTERRGEFVAKNIPFEKFQPIFEGGVGYYR